MRHHVDIGSGGIRDLNHPKRSVGDIGVAASREQAATVSDGLASFLAVAAVRSGRWHDDHHR